MPFAERSPFWTHSGIFISWHWCRSSYAAHLSSPKVQIEERAPSSILPGQLSSSQLCRKGSCWSGWSAVCIKSEQVFQVWLTVSVSRQFLSEGCKLCSHYSRLDTFPNPVKGQRVKTIQSGKNPRLSGGQRCRGERDHGPATDECAAPSMECVPRVCDPLLLLWDLILQSVHFRVCSLLSRV